MKLQRALWAAFGFIRETMIKSRYKQTSKGKAEQQRCYWEERTVYTRQHSQCGNTLQTN